MNFVFGPVPSRRLGKSLGIDPVPLKTCNWNCVYCQLGRSKPLTNERKVFFPVKEILDRVEETIKTHNPGSIGWITFVGSGETTLCADLGLLIRGVKELTKIPLAVITNGSLLYLPEVRRELSEADAVLPSLDAGNPLLYRKINRPHPAITFERLLFGLKAFRSEFKGKLWLEVMLVKGLNDNEQTLRELACHIRDIDPDEIHLLQPTRPPVEEWVQPSDPESVLLALTILGQKARLIDALDGDYYLNKDQSLVNAVVEIITRHPMKDSELRMVLGNLPQVDVQSVIDELLDSGKAIMVSRNEINYWVSSGSKFPNKT
jgi:wyosine [tRNA(Phe)-imidazoG37] synthetase (radical SAM superfamily)